MLTDGVFYTGTSPQEFVYRNIANTDTRKIVKGGVDINNITQGRFSFNWSVYYNNSQIHIQREGLPISISIPATNVKSVGAAFDISSMPFVCWSDHKDTYLYYRDTILSQYTTIKIDNAQSSAMNIDYTDEYNIPVTDVIFAYVKNNNLYYRYQRDRFQTEHLVGPTDKYLVWVGTTVNRCLQFELVLPIMQTIVVDGVSYSVPRKPEYHPEQIVNEVPVGLYAENNKFSTLQVKDVPLFLYNADNVNFTAPTESVDASVTYYTGAMYPILVEDDTVLSVSVDQSNPIKNFLMMGEMSEDTLGVSSVTISDFTVVKTIEYINTTVEEDTLAVSNVEITDFTVIKTIEYINTTIEEDTLAVSDVNISDFIIEKTIEYISFTKEEDTLAVTDVSLSDFTLT